jgi:hypothetical protein
VNHGPERCISFGGVRADHAVGTEMVLKPLGIDAAVKALDAQAGETSVAKGQLEVALQRARFEVAHAQLLSLNLAQRHWLLRLNGGKQRR